MPGHPADFGKLAILRIAAEFHHLEEDQQDGITAGILVRKATDLPTDLGVQVQLFAQLTPQASGQLLAILNLAAGKLPLQRQELVGATPTDEELLAAHNQSYCDCAHADSAEAAGLPRAFAHSRQVGRGMRNFSSSCTSVCGSRPRRAFR